MHDNMVLTFLQLCLFVQFMWLCKASSLTGVPQEAIVDEEVNITLACEVNVDNTVVTWYRNNTGIAQISGYLNGTCKINDRPGNFTSFLYQCDPSNRRYLQIMPVMSLSESEHYTKWTCNRLFENVLSNAWSIKVAVLVTSVVLTPSSNDNGIDVVQGDTQIFNCRTTPSRPAAWIQWYIGGQNVTGQASSQSNQTYGDKFISSSSLIYTGRETDHNTSIYCEAFNIEGRRKASSFREVINIQVPVSTVTITQSANNNVIDIVEGENDTFTCTTGPSRPAAGIQWYIGESNVTNQATSLPTQQDGDMFIASSRLLYIAKDTDHNKSLHCEAINVKGKAAVHSTTITVSIKG